jgi:hypothetical protein
MKTLDEFILNLFRTYWRGSASENIELAKHQLYKNLTDQINGYWSGYSAYHIMTYGGFLVDAKHKNGKSKKLTALGKEFMESMAPERQQDQVD